MNSESRCITETQTSLGLSYANLTCENTIIYTHESGTIVLCTISTANPILIRHRPQVSFISFMQRNKRAKRSTIYLTGFTRTYLWKMSIFLTWTIFEAFLKRPKSPKIHRKEKRKGEGRERREKKRLAYLMFLYRLLWR